MKTVEEIKAAWLPTFLAMAGDADVTDKLLKGYTIGDMTYKVHLDGHNLLPYLTGEARRARGSRSSTATTTSSSWHCATTIGSWYSRNSGSPARSGSGPSRSSPFACQSCSISARTPSSARTSLRSPTTIGWSITPTCLSRRRPISGNSCATFRDYPQRQKAASFNLDDVLRKLQESTHH